MMEDEMKEGFVVEDPKGRFFQYGKGFKMCRIFLANVLSSNEIEQIKPHYQTCGQIKKYPAEVIGGQTVITGPAEDF